MGVVAVSGSNHTKACFCEKWYIDKIPDVMCIKIEVLSCIFMSYCCAHSKTITQSKSEGRRSFFWISSLRVGVFESL